MAIEKSYIDMIKERDVKIEALRELLKLAHDKLGSQSDMIAELEKDKASQVPVLAWIARECNQVDGVMLHRFKSYLAIRDLEQQAIGVYESVWFCKFEGVITDEQPNRHISHLLNARVKELRNQAKALKEQGK
jgi:hypothetical protein